MSVVCASESVANGGQKRVKDPLELQEVVSHLVWVLRTKRSSAGAACDCNHWPSLQTPIRLSQCCFLFLLGVE